MHDAQTHDQAKACAEEAKAAGMPIVELKDATEGDLEAFLVRRQNAAYDRRGGGNGGLAGTGERFEVGEREASHGSVEVHPHVVEMPV